MVTAVNTQALASSVSSSRAEKPDPDQQSKQLGSGDKGSLAAGDLQAAAVVKISAEGASRAAAGGQQAAAPSTQDVVAQVDQDGDGKVTAHEFENGVPKEPQTRVKVDQGHAGAASVAGQSTASSGGASPISSSSKTYDPADTNEDGTVSAQEEQSYDAKLAADKAAQAAASSNRSAEANAAVKAYVKVEQLSQDGGTAAA